MKLFEAREYDYSDEGKQKPILYDETFFKEVIKDVDSVDILDKHDGKVIGHATNLYFKDGWLHGDIPIDLNGKGLSPLFDAYLLDKGDYELAREGEFKHIALADNPRNQLLYNEKGNGKMSDNNSDVSEFFTNRVKELERELAVANNQLESNKKKLESYNELENEVKELRKANSDYEVQLESNKNKATKWDEYVTSKRESLVDEIAGDDSTMREEIKDWDIDKLNFLLEHKNINTDPKGVGNGTDGNVGDVSDPKPTPQQEQQQMLNEVDSMFEELKSTEE